MTSFYPLPLDSLISMHVACKIHFLCKNIYKKFFSVEAYCFEEPPPL
jgi:hypothetical protein